jgi:hypothetical protein
MEHMTRSEFNERFPRPKPVKQFDGTCNTLIAENDVHIGGLIQNVIVRSGVHAVITGLVEQSLVVEQGAVVYVDGLIDGRAQIDGAACIDGHVAGRIWGNGIVYDSSDPTPEDTVAI